VNDRDDRMGEAFLEDPGSAPAPAGLAANGRRCIGDGRPMRTGRIGPRLAAPAAIVALALLAGIAVIACGPTPSPSVATVPSGVASASPSSSRSSAPSGSPAATAIPSSASTPAPTAAPTPSPLASFHAMLDPLGRPLLVTDASATVRAVAVVRPGLTAASPVEVTQGASPNQVIVGWTGGGCDQLVVIAVDAAATTVTVSTAPATVCDAGAVDRAVRLTFAGPATASSIRGRLGSAPRLAVAIPRIVWFSDGSHGYVAGVDTGTGLAVMATTLDGGATWDTSALGWGFVAGLGVIGSSDLMEVPLVALGCAEQGDGGTPEEGCLAGVYRMDGVTRVRLLAIAPLVMATQGKSIAVMGAVPPASGGTTAYAPVDIRVSSDGGAHWGKVANPCDLQTIGTGGLTFDATGHLVVLCEGQGAGGGSRKQLQRAADNPPTTWTTMPPLPERGTGMQLDLTADGHGLAWGARSPLLTTADGGSSWAEHQDVADGDVRIVEDASAFAGGGGAALVWDPGRQAMRLLVSGDGLTWREAAAYPG
jgi:hypothetical protein